MHRVTSTLVPLIAALAHALAAASHAVSQAPPGRGADALTPAIEWAELPAHIDLPPGLRDSVRFGYLRVPQDHGDPAGPTLRMAFAIIRSSGRERAPDPVMFIRGGPGLEGVTPHFASRLRGPHPLDVHRDRRDLIVFDQRGNGLSQPRTCAALDGPAIPQADTEPNAAVERAWRDSLASCRARLLQAGVRLETLNAVQVAHDIEWLRRALGVPRLNLLGNSYGSRIAAEVVRWFPASVRAVHFSMPVPPGRHRLGLRPDTENEVLHTLFERCAAHPRCQAAYPRLRLDYDAVIAGLRAAPFRVSLPASSAGAAAELVVDEDVMRSGLASLLSNRDLAAGAPLLIHTIHRRGRDFLVRMAPQMAQELAEAPDYIGTALAFWCNDGGINAASTDLLQLRCRAWLGEDWTPAVPAPLHSDAPALIDTGELDPRTPPSHAHFLAAGLSRAHVVIVPWYGHEAPPACAWRLARDFIAEPGTPPDAACLDSIPPIDFVTGVTYSRWVGATVARLWQRPWLGVLPGTAVLLLLVAAVGIPLREVRQRAGRTTKWPAASVVLLVLALVALLFAGGAAAAVFAGARQHFFVPAIGVPRIWTWTLALPWILLGLAPLAAAVVWRAREDGRGPGIAGWSAVIGSALLLVGWIINLLF